MMNWRRKTSIYMLLVLASMLLSTLFASSEREENCGEFGHIHRFHFHLSGQSTTQHTVQKSGHESGRDADDDCHAGQSLSGAFLFPMAPLIAPFHSYDVEMELVAVIENNYPSPWIEPLKKPPKLSLT